DIERWKDKIEVHLDNRQVFFLFFGSALVACMLFVLGVIVGKRIESRGRADAPEVQDPLAALDRVNQPAGGPQPTAAQSDQALTFPKALIGSSPKAKPAPPAAKVATPAAPVPTKVTTPAIPVPVGPGKTLTATAVPAASAPVVASKPAAAPAKATATTPVKVAVAPRLVPAVAAPSAPAPVAPVAAADAKVARGKFTLQLSSFPDRTEAEAFAKRFASQGAFVITSDIPGKGTWYRVRVGNYSSAQEASTAKTTFEKQHSIIAYVAAR
ncbi:MAG TPA: SPOR domain-containing protein, partial [Polyangia bacterium]|nr:SPOR domain-containing protein [Polyangia bacterium]